MKTLVYCWEMGSGFGHVGPFSPVAKRFLSDGWRVVLIVKDLGRVAPFFEFGEVDVLQAPIKNSYPVPHVAEPPTYGHMLFNMGYQHADELAAQVEAWRHLFTFLQPDLLVFDHSPTAMLAARGLSAPQATFGTGFCCPPATEPLPLLAEWRPMPEAQRRRDEAELTDRVNAVLSRGKQPPLVSLASLFREIDAHLLTTWPELDHYGTRPDTTYYGTWSLHRVAVADPVVEQWQLSGGKKVFAYVNPMKGLSHLVTCLGKADAETLMVINSADVRPLQQLAKPNVRIVDRLVSLRSVLECGDVAILNGSHNSVAEFLLAGIPLLVLPLHLEQAILGKRIESLQAAAVALPQDAEGVSRQLHAILQRPERLAGAREFRARHAGQSDTERVERVFDRLRELQTES